MEKILVVDRIEGDIAVCENRENQKMEEIKISKLPKDVKEGTVIRYKYGRYRIDTVLQEEIEKRIQDKMNDIWDD